MNINELIKGIIIGIAKIIPGLSGAVLMISFNLYDRAIDAVTNFFEQPKKNFLFLLNLGLGIVLGIVFFSKILHFFITNYYLYTVSLFIGLILGGIPAVIKRVEKKNLNYFIMFFSFLIMSMLSLSNIDHSYVLRNNYLDIFIFFLSGILEAIGTVLPGISSTALLMLVGVYDYYIATLSNVLNFELLKETIGFILPFFLGLFFGIILISLLVNYLFKFYKEQTFSFILGVSFSSVFLLMIKLFPFIEGIFSIIFSFILLLVGYLITYKL